MKQLLAIPTLILFLSSCSNPKNGAGDQPAPRPEKPSITRTTEIVTNSASVVALMEDGSFKTWGAANTGADISAVSGQLHDVKTVVATENAFAALRSNGQVVSWGYGPHGGDSSLVSSELLTDVEAIVAGNFAFAAINHKGKVITWGAAASGGDSHEVASQIQSGVKTVHAFKRGMVAEKLNGDWVGWGETASISPALNVRLRNNVVKTLSAWASSSSTTYAAVLKDGGAEFWGGLEKSYATGVKDIVTDGAAYAVLKADGSVDIFGRTCGFGTPSPGNAFSSDVVTVAPMKCGFAALKSDGSVVTWHYNNYQYVVERFPQSSFASIEAISVALIGHKTDGSIVIFGGDLGLPPDIQSQLKNRQIKQIISTHNTVPSKESAIALLTDDGAVFTFGGLEYGGDSSLVKEQLKSGVVKIFNTEFAMIALKDDGSTVAWGKRRWGGDVTCIDTETSSDKPEGSCTR